ncbi:Arabinose operon regulatory protein [Mixta intestinalis]|uniref:Arabinose operon regulatory protein n=1 Tax=Mixta intestinalis TaxID=1615494 RepID=A0A6P1PZ23_9GAMM|nr:Arabinose operon regulatory protein [Mixta intestinalis]
MYHRQPIESQPNPLLPGYPFNAWLVAGLTPISAGGARSIFQSIVHTA